MHHSQTSKRCSVAPQQHSQLGPFNILQLRFIPLHLLLSQKMLTNLSNHFCNMLHRTTARSAICHVSLHSVNIYLPKLDCSANTYFCGLVHMRAQRWLSDRVWAVCRRQLWDTAGVCCCWQCVVEAAWLLPLHMVQVPWYTQSPDGVEFAVVHQTVVSAASHRHPGHQIPVVQKGHVAPDISHHDTGLCPTLKNNKGY